MKVRFFTFFFLLPSVFLIAQNGQPLAAGAKGAAMANASTTFRTIHAAFSNQAGLAFLDQPSVLLFTERRFGIAELNSFAAAAALPSRLGTFGLTVQYFGFSAYNEQKIGLSYARRLAEKVSIGVQFDYLNTRISEYGSRGVVTFEAGVQARLAEKFWLGAAVYSPAAIQLTPETTLPALFSLGASYEFSKNLTLAAEVEKDLEYPARAKVGVDYRIHKVLSLRLGVGSPSVQTSFGIGLHLDRFLLDVAAVYHEVLGFSPSLSFVYDLSKKNKKTK